MRVAFYYAPHQDDPLWHSGARWLGRDPAANTPLAQPDLPGIAAITADARHYAFHATLKPPMALGTGVDWAAVLDAAHAIAACIPPFDLPRLAVADIHGFLALRETSPSPELQAFADACIAGADHLRRPPEAGELERRRRAGLSPAAEANLRRWGYPSVFANWFFQMTLTRRLTADQHAFWRPAAEAHFADVLGLPRRVSDLCLFTQAEATAAFVLARRIPLRG